MRDYLEDTRSVYHADRLPDGWWEQKEKDRQYREERAPVYAPGPDDYRPEEKKKEDDKKKNRGVIVIDYGSDEEDDKKKKGPIEIDIKDCPTPEEADSE
ncbi:hypothetical protein KY349_00500 [Candidatus Woesearchaeota archaeon]|jgi:hypothetical protein|nr:hypothetical protein [Candidatus Woesearchaeota archaeon]